MRTPERKDVFYLDRLTVGISDFLEKVFFTGKGCRETGFLFKLAIKPGVIAALLLIDIETRHEFSQVRIE